MTDQKQEEFRILISDLATPLNPIALVLGIQADSHQQAHELAGKITDPIEGVLPKNVRRLGLRFEEVLPLMRKGYPARRQSWATVLIAQIHPKRGRIDLYERNIQDPYIRPPYLSEWGEECHVDQDILAEDWTITVSSTMLPANRVTNAT